MKPLKGQLEVGQDVKGAWYWSVRIPGRFDIIADDRYASEKGTKLAAQRVAKRCGIILEVSRAE